MSNETGKVKKRNRVFCRKLFCLKSLWLVLVLAAVLPVILFHIGKAQSVPPPLPPLPAIEGKFCLLTEIREFQKRLIDIDLMRESPAVLLEPYLKILYRSSPENFPDLATQAEELIGTLFSTRMILREKLRVFHESGRLLEEVSANSIRDAFRAGRYLEDFLAAEYLPRTEAGVLQGGAPWLLINSGSGTAADWSRADLRSGDLLLSRGNAVTSAAIARMSLPPLQFSHLAMVYRQPETGQFFTVEAFIESGSAVKPLDDYFHDGKVRSLLFRYHDSDTAHRAAEYMYQRILRFKAETGLNIPYDFALDASDDTTLFCSEIPYWGFKKAEEQDFRLPLYPSKLNPDIKDFHRALGIKAESAFLPADIELDTRFELICEWRDVNRIRGAHRRDVVLSSIYQWMSERDYAFHDFFRGSFTGSAAYALRRIPWIGSWLLGKKVSPDMTREMLKTIINLQNTAGILEAQLQFRHSYIAAQRGTGLTFPEAMFTLEHFRGHDQALFDNGRKSQLHRYFRPPDTAVR